MEQQRKQNKMGVMPCGRLLITMSAPIMFSMLMQALYNVVDSIFVSGINENALTAVSLCFPIQILMISVAVGTGIGINAVLSRKLGEKKYEEANAVAMNGLFLSGLSWIVFAVLGATLTVPFFRMFTDNPEIMKMGIDYTYVVTIASIGLFVGICTDRLVQATGNTIYVMYTQLTGAIINIILDPILIFGLLGFPKMGVTGAAVATVFGQIVAMLLGLYINKTRNKEIELKFRSFRANVNIIKEIYIVGAPSIIMQAIMSILTFCMNKILIQFNETAVSVFGVYFKLQSFIFMPVFGLTSGMIPIVAYNYGAKNRKRITTTIKYALIIAVAIMSFGTAIFTLFPETLLSFFNADKKMIEIGVPALQIISLCFPLAAISIMLSSVFQAFGNGMFSLILSVVRQLVFLLPIAYLLSKVSSLSKIWYAFPIAELPAIIISLILFYFIYQKHIKNMDKKIIEK